MNSELHLQYNERISKYVIVKDTLGIHPRGANIEGTIITYEEWRERIISSTVLEKCLRMKIK